MDDLGRLAAMVRWQADACGLNGSPLYADLLSRVADEVAAGGPLADVLADHAQDSAADAVPLRLMGAVHQLVLSRQAPRLALHYPSVGGRPGPGEDLWSAFRATVLDHAGAVRAGLRRPPQTNEVGRSAALLGGLLHLASAHALPVRLHEIGASGGLNLRADAFRYDDAGGRRLWGPANSPVVLTDAWRGPTPPVRSGLRVVERVGYDIAPVDVSTTQGRLVLTSYVWPDQLERLERLRGAFAVAATVPAPVRRVGAAAALRALRLVEGSLTVVWHSVMWQYVGAGEQAAAAAALDDLGRAATAAAPFARLSLEPVRIGREHEFQLRSRSWPGGSERLLGSAEPHGLPTTWRDAGSGAAEGMAMQSDGGPAC